ncbi:hypothetical protein [Streptosporangium sp. KLBMP 9127]|nr:hypothetical protein [Streptosporangium sp. KLBMP 9127]
MTQDPGSEPAASLWGSQGQERLWAVANVIAPTTAVTTLLFYFGYVATTARFRYFGVYLDMVDLSLQEMLLYGVEVVFPPLIVLAVVSLLVIALHTAVRYLQSSPDRDVSTGWTGLFAVVAGLLAFTRGVVGVLVPHVARNETIATTPVSLAGGAVAMAYGLSLLRTIGIRWAHRRSSPHPPPATPPTTASAVPVGEAAVARAGEAAAVPVGEQAVARAREGEAAVARAVEATVPIGEPAVARVGESTVVPVGEQAGEVPGPVGEQAGEVPGPVGERAVARAGEPAATPAEVPGAGREGEPVAVPAGEAAPVGRDGHLAVWLESPAVTRLSRYARAWVAVIVVAASFWTANSFAADYGRGRALDDVQSLRFRPELVLYAKEPLRDVPAGVVETVLTVAEKEPYRFRYRGLRLLVESNARLFLVPAVWVAGSSRTIVVPYDKNVRIHLIAG